MSAPVTPSSPAVQKQLFEHLGEYVESWFQRATNCRNEHGIGGAKRFLGSMARLHRRTPVLGDRLQNLPLHAPMLMPECAARELDRIEYSFCEGKLGRPRANDSVTHLLGSFMLRAFQPFKPP